MQQGSMDETRSQEAGERHYTIPQEALIGATAEVLGAAKLLCNESRKTGLELGLVVGCGVTDDDPDVYTSTVIKGTKTHINFSGGILELVTQHAIPVVLAHTHPTYNKLSDFSALDQKTWHTLSETCCTVDVLGEIMEVSVRRPVFVMLLASKSGPEDDAVVVLVQTAATVDEVAITEVTGGLRAAAQISTAADLAGGSVLDRYTKLMANAGFEVRRFPMSRLDDAGNYILQHLPREVTIRQLEEKPFAPPDLGALRKLREELKGH